MNTDNSRALMNAVTESFNECKLSVYIELCYSYQSQGKPLPKDFTILHLCSAHFLHQISCKLKRMKNVDSMIYKFCMKLMNMIVCSKNFQNQKRICSLMVHVLGHEFYDDKVASALEEIAKCMEECDKKFTVSDSEVTYRDINFDIIIKIF